MIGKKKRYRVTVKAVGPGPGETTLGNVVVEAKDREAALRLGREKLWTAEHEASGATADVHAERIAGEGG
ncbi:MAG: hypothetical protein ACKO2K_12540 [Alphaproteobacteria bacterium]